MIVTTAPMTELMTRLAGIALLMAVATATACVPPDRPGPFGVRNETGQDVIVRLIGQDGEEADFLAPARSTVRLATPPASLATLTLLLEYECLEAGGMDFDGDEFEFGGTIVLDERRDVTFEEMPPPADTAPALLTTQCHEG